MNSVDSLIKYPFCRRTLEEKVQVKQLGRQTPNLNITQLAKGGKNNSYTRRFNLKIYEHAWICGCQERNALFCFPCLLFGNSDSWSTTGVTDLGHINVLINKHKQNVKHLNNVLDLSALGSTNIVTQLSRAYQEAKLKHNIQVEKNRYVLSRIIDCIKFCGAFELALRGHDETESSENPGVFLGLIDLVSNIDNAVKEHMDSNHIFKGTSKTIQNELLDCMLEVCREVILEEMQEADFVAVMADETTDVSHQSQLVLVFRYEKNGVPCERFWGFLQPEGQNAEAISESILKVLNELFRDKRHKLIAQTYDGASVMSGAVGVQAKVQSQFPNARYIHCYAHQLNLVMEHAASQNKSARIFFLNLSAFPAFFSRSPQRLAALDSAVARRVPGGSATRWNFRSRTVNVVYENQEELLQCFSELENSAHDKTCLEANGLRRYLEDRKFLSWLKFFHRVMPHVDVLYNQLQSRSTEAVKVENAVSSFIQCICDIREAADDIFMITSEPMSKRQKVEYLKIEAKEVCDRIIEEARRRFQSLSHLDAAKLLNSKFFGSFLNQFPEAELQTAVNTYTTLNKKMLKTQLSVLYARPDFRNIDGAVQLLQYIISNSLQDSFSEVTTLLKILVTTPMTTAEPERCFSCLKRVKTFLRNTMSQDRLTALAMLSMEKSIASKMEGFNTRVIDKFCSRKERRMDFIFRH